MAKNTVLTLIFVIWFCRPMLGHGETPWRSFCGSGEPVEIDGTGEEGKGEILVKELTKIKSWLVHVNTDNAQGIDLSLQDYELEDFFLVIQDGCESTNPDPVVQFVSGKSSKVMKFGIPFGKSFHLEICPENVNFKTVLPAKFNLTFNRIDRFPEDYLPGDEVDQDSYEIQLKGQTVEKFKDESFRKRFQEALRNIARDYCKLFHIDFNEERTAEEMVKILKVSKCPPEWFESSCVSVNHSIFVSMEREPDTMRTREEKELTIRNLIRMWKLCENKYIEDIGMSVFKLKEKNDKIGWWFTVIILPLILIVFILIIMKKICDNFFIHPQNDFSTTMNSETHEKRRVKKLEPNKFQTVPPFMKNATNSRRRDVTDSYDKRPQYSAAMIFCMDRLTRKNFDNSYTGSAL